MPKLHTQEDGKVLVDQDFVNSLLERFGSEVVRIPYGFRIYPDTTGSNEICLIKHDPIPEFKNSPCWLVITQPDREEVFRKISEDVLGKRKMARLVSDVDLSNWTLTKTSGLEKEAAPKGLYGYTRKIQAMCESAERRLQRKAGSLIRKVSKRDQRSLEFLGTHAKRGKSIPAKMLVKAFVDGMPKLGSHDDEFEADLALFDDEESCHCGGECTTCKTVTGLRQAADSIEKTRLDIIRAFETHRWTMGKTTWKAKVMPTLGGGAGTKGSPQVRGIFQDFIRDGIVIEQGQNYTVAAKYRKHTPDFSPKIASTRMYSMYGYPIRTAELSLQACNELRIEAGHIAADLHQRQASLYDGITGFLNDHVKTAHSLSGKLLLSVYPEQRMFRTANVDEWLSLDPEF